MIDLLKSNNGLILTKFLNKIWRRYSFFSNLGELFITQKDLKRFAPNYKFNESLILDRVIEAEESLEDEDGENNDEDDNKDNASENDKDAS